MAQFETLSWKVVTGLLVEHSKSGDGRTYCIYILEDPKGQVMYGATRRWEMMSFRLNWDDLPQEMLSDWRFFTTLNEARHSVGNMNNEERGIEPFEYNQDDYTAELQKHYCLCCGYKTLEGHETNFGFTKPPNTQDICEICFWQDDPIDYAKLDEPWGPNDVSFRQAQQNFLEIGVSEERLLPYVRKPTDQDERDPNWALR